MESFWWIKTSASVVSIALPLVLIMSGLSKRKAISKNAVSALNLLRRARNQPV
jgi:hypothetical protein